MVNWDQGHLLYSDMIMDILRISKNACVVGDGVFASLVPDDFSRNFETQCNQHLCVDVCSQQCFSYPPWKLLLVKLHATDACHICTTDNCRSLFRGRLSLWFFPLPLQQGQLQVRNSGGDVGAIHLFLPEGVLPTDRKMVFLDNETVLRHLISGRGGGGGLIDNTIS